MSERLRPPDDGYLAGTDFHGVEDTEYLISSDDRERINQAAGEIVAAEEAALAAPLDGFLELPFPVSGGAEEALDEQVFPDEAPTQAAREHAREFVLILLMMTAERFAREETLPAPAELTEAYAAYTELIARENDSEPRHAQLPGFTFGHLAAATRRYWQRAFDAAEGTETEELALLDYLDRTLTQAVDEGRGA